MLGGEQLCVICQEPVDYSGEWPDVGDYGYPRPSDQKPVHRTCDLKEQVKALKAENERLRAVLSACRVQLLNLLDHHCGGRCDSHGEPCESPNCHMRIMRSVQKAVAEAQAALRGESEEEGE